MKMGIKYPVLAYYPLDYVKGRTLAWSITTARRSN